MNCALTEDQVAVRETFREFARRVVAPVAAELDANPRYPHEIVREAGELGLFAMRYPPPDGLGLDKCRSGPEVGSRAVREFFAEHQPRLGLHGHIHESPEESGRWYGAIGRTVCIQPGQMRPFTYAVIDLDRMEFERHTE